MEREPNLNLATLIIGLLLTALLFGFGLGYFVAWLRNKFRNVGKSLLLTIPEVPGTWVDTQWVKMTDGKVERPSREHDALRGDKDALLPAGAASYPMRGALKGPLHMMTSYGQNLIAPSKLEAAATLEKEVLADWVVNYNRQPKGDDEDEEVQNLYIKAWNEAKKVGLRFRVWDGLRYWKATRENDMQDLYESSGASRDPWYAKAAFIAIVIVGGILLLVLAALMLKVLPALQQGAGV